MKAFVIKNKEGEYLEEGKDRYGEDTIIWHKDIVYADIYSSKEIAEMRLEPFYRGCEVVEVTIAEGDLETYIDKLQEERDFEVIDKTLIVKQLNDPNQYVNREDYIKLEQRLAQKDEKIKSLQNQLVIWQVGNKIANQYSQEILEKYQQKLQELELQIRHQVCDKIRHFDLMINKQGISYTEYVTKLLELLIDIEKGE